MHNTHPISSKSLRQERWAKEGKEILVYIMAGLGALTMVGGIGLWVIALSM